MHPITKNACTFFLKEADKLNRRTQVVNEYEKKMAEKKALKAEEEEGAEDGGWALLYAYYHITCVLL